MFDARRGSRASGAFPFAIWGRLLIAGLILWGGSNLLRHPLLPSLTAQEVNPSDVVPAPAPINEPALDPSAPTGAPGSASAARPRTLLDTIRDGGYIGIIIMLLSLVAVGFMIEHAMTIRKERLMPEGDLTTLQDLVAKGELNAARQFCEDPRNYSLASDVILAGIERYQSSEFGFADYKSAVEEAGEDFTARLYRKTDVLAVIGAVAPMLGLFGTVEGMMESFNTIASHGGMARPDELASSIGKALVTTWLGLIVAIPSMIAFSYFRNKIDSIVSECGKRVERVLAPLARRGKPAAGREGRS
jgi:biopolymer transport protein ExbB